MPDKQKKKSMMDAFKANMAKVFQTPGSVMAKGSDPSKRSRKVKQFRKGLGLDKKKAKKY